MRRIDARTWRRAGCALVVWVGAWGVGCARLAPVQTARSKHQAEQPRWEAQRAEAYVRIAEDAYRAGRLDEALERLSPVFRLDPRCAAAHALAGRIYVEKGQASRAAEAFAQALERSPNDAAVHYQLGVLLHQAGQFEESLKHLAKAWKLAPHEMSYAMALAAGYAESEDAERAEEVLTEASERWPAATEPLAVLGGLYESQGHAAAAVEVYTRLLRLEPDHREARQNRADCYFEIGEYQRAARELSLLVEDPEVKETAAILLALGDSLLKSNQLQRAQAAYERAGELAPNDADVVVARARCALVREECAEAARLYAAALGQEGNRLEALRGLAAACYKLGRYEDAAAAMERAVVLDSQDPMNYFLCGCALARSGNHQAAVARLRQAVALDPEFQVAQKHLQRLEAEASRGHRRDVERR